MARVLLFNRRDTLKRILLILMALAAAWFCQGRLDAQTNYTLSDTAFAGCNPTTQPCTNSGLNLGQASGDYPQFKNMIAFANPGNEPQLVQQIFQFAVNPCTYCSTTQFQWNLSNTNFTDYLANQWVGATFRVTAGCYSGMTGCTGGGGTGDPAYGCTGTIASNTVATGGVGSEFTTSAACPGVLGIPGQVIIISTNSSMSNVGPPSVVGWPQSTISTTGSATITAENTDLCAACGTQAMLFTVPAGSTASFLYRNTTYNEGGALKTILMNGNYTVKFWAKLVSGSATGLTFTATARNNNCSNGNPGPNVPCPYNPTLTGSWVQYTHTFALNESVTPDSYYAAGLAFSVAAGTTVEVDNVEFDDPSTNPTAWSDHFVNALKAHCQTASNTTGPPCTFRYGPSPDSETLANWTKPIMQAQPSTEAANSTNIQFQVPQAYFTMKPRLYDFFQLNAYIGSLPVLIIPITLSNADAAGLMDYIYDPCTLGSGPYNPCATQYGQVRYNQGQHVAWVGQTGSPFAYIFLEVGNENWNGLFLGHALFGHTNNPNNYYDYAIRGGQISTAGRAEITAQGYNANLVKWMANYQTGESGDVSYLVAFWCGSLSYSGGAITGCTHGGPDGIEYNQYYAASGINQVSTSGCLTAGSSNATCPLYGPTLTEPYSDYYDPSSTTGAAQDLTAIKAVTACGINHNAACLPATYERAIYPIGTTNFTQAVSDTFTQAGAHGVADATSYSEANHNGLAYIEEYASQAYYLFQNGIDAHIYGEMLDSGGDTSATNAALFGGDYTPRPQMGAAEVVNSCNIGREVTQPSGTSPTYNLPSNTNGVHALNGVPALTLHEYCNVVGGACGTQRCLLIENRDVYNSYPVTFSGTNVPATVTLFQQVPSSPSVSNEATALNPTSTVGALVYPTTSTGVNVGSGFTAAPMSTNALTWSTGASTSVTANFNSRTGGAVIPPTLFGTGISGLSGSTPLYYLLPPVGLTHARLFSSLLQECPTGIGSCNWSITNGQMALLAAQGMVATINFFATPSNLGASACTPPSNNASYAAIINAYFAQNPYPNNVDSAELRNEPDSSTSDWCPGGSALTAYESFIGAVGPAVASANPGILVGGPALGAPGADAAIWIPGVVAAWPGIGFVSYHLYLDSTCTAWASCLAGMQSTTNGVGFWFATMSGLVSGAGSSAPTWVTEFNDGYAFSADCCRFDNQYSLIWNTLNAADYLNVISTYGATVLPGRLHYYTDESTGYFCLFGNIAGANCASTPTPLAPYPQYYSYDLLGLLGLPLGGNLAASISPASTVSGLSAAAWYTVEGDSVLMVNPTASAMSGVTITFNNTGISNAEGTIYLLNSSNPQNTASVLTLTSIGGTSYTATVNIPAYSSMGALINFGTTQISHGAIISGGAVIR